MVVGRDWGGEEGRGRGGERGGKGDGVQTIQGTHHASLQARTCGATNFLSHVPVDMAPTALHQYAGPKITKSSRRQHGEK